MPNEEDLGCRACGLFAATVNGFVRLRPLLRRLFGRREVDVEVAAKSECPASNIRNLSVGSSVHSKATGVVLGGLSLFLRAKVMSFYTA